MPALANPTHLPPAALAAVTRDLANLLASGTLLDVVRSGLAHRPPLLIADVIVQDEFTHDVILPVRDGLHLVYDTT